MEILNEMPRLKDQFSVTFPNTVDQETKTSANIQSNLPWGREGREYDPTDSKQHMKRDSRTFAKGATTWRFVGVSNKKALRLRHEQEGAGMQARLRSGKGSELWTHGWKHGRVHLLQWKRVYLWAYLGGAWVVEAGLRVVEDPKQQMPCGRLKAEIRPRVSLPTAKPLGWFYTSCQEFHTLIGGSGDPVGAALHLRTSQPGRSWKSWAAAAFSHFLVSGPLALGKGSFGKSQFRGVEPRWIGCEQSHPRQAGKCEARRGHWVGGGGLLKSFSGRKAWAFCFVCLFSATDCSLWWPVSRQVIRGSRFGRSYGMVLIHWQSNPRGQHMQ